MWNPPKAEKQAGKNKAQGQNPDSKKRPSEARIAPVVFFVLDRRGNLENQLAVISK